MSQEEDTLVNKISSYMSAASIDSVKKACKLAIDSHGSQLRNSGAPYYSHPLEVAIILADMKLDCTTIITALLHDTVEDTDLELSFITKEFGIEISKLVDGVTKLTKIENQSEHSRQADNFRKLLLAMSDDIRVLLVKLADRLHNMRTIEFVKSQDKRLRIAHETMEIYAPLAERIGMQSIKSSLQDLAFSELYPETRRSIQNRLDFLRSQDKNLVEKIVDQISNLLKEASIKGAVSGREKSPYSIWQKMERKNVGFEQLSDIMAFRVLVDSVSDCYQVLGLIHSNYNMVPDNFRDFISIPKDNGYQSIHTVIVGPEHQRIEIQIRTYLMHEVAELGVAAHWSYKQQYDYNVDGKQFRWMRELLDILEHASDSEEFLENTKMEMYYSQVFCFTPKGKLIALPKGATPVDFAYAVHSNVGHSCVGAKVNGRIVPLRVALNNGDQVEIIRSKTHVPSASWEKFVITGKARSEIKKFIRTQKRQEYLNLGRVMLSKTFKNDGYEFVEKDLESCLETFKKKNIEDLLVAVGEGTIVRNDVLKAKHPAKKEPTNLIQDKLSFLNFKKKATVEKVKESSMPIKGLMPGMAIHYPGCCHPLPGDNIVGIVHTGKGVTIHIIDCEILDNFASNPERWVNLSWAKDVGEESYTGRIKAIVSNDAVSLATITSVVAKEKGNISNLKIINRSTDFFEIIIDIEVKGTSHIYNIIMALRGKSCIHSVDRFKL
ncbi:GTP pyrophosphokinase rsh [Candidatus Arcanobacter lacustris]|jgi:GTP pyrophosphokinase|uniref:GTP pyrophosphokinase rsh n=1 Tax=Candidatus Arcanibacter lacustris TaxID=1607817 RepID=A0A0F5MRU0_9RICK|nr:GTP pyrophosphokinase rsh [Candidatus Arcanobacter lacustris]